MDATAGFLVIPEQRLASIAIDVALARLELANAETLAREPLLLMFHGPAGCGKSRLVRELMARARGRSLTIQCCDVTSLDGKPDLSESLAEPSDLLIAEDLQYLPLGAVERLLGDIDRQQAHGGTVVVTANAGPRHLRFRGQPYPTRLTSRLAGGLVVPIGLPGPESRRAILERWLTGAKVPESVLDEIAARGRTFRCLEGAMQQFDALARLGPFHENALLEHFREQMVADVSVEKILQRVAGHFCVSIKDVRSRSRRRGVVVPRHVSMYLARRLTGMSLADIGAYFGGCDHATVLHACRKMEQTLDADPILGGAVKQLQEELV